jgi:hypothetical protein
MCYETSSLTLLEEHRFEDIWKQSAEEIFAHNEEELSGGCKSYVMRSLKICIFS